MNRPAVAPYHDLGRAVAAAATVRPPTTPVYDVIDGIRRGDVVGVAGALDYPIELLLFIAHGDAVARGVPSAVRVANGRMPWRPEQLLGIYTDIVIGAPSPRDTWAKPIVEQAFRDEVGRAPTITERQVIQAIGRLEGFYGYATTPAGWSTSHNWGAVQCKHGAPCGDDCFGARDTHADGTPYEWCFKRYATDYDGARDLVRLVTTKRPTVLSLLRTGNVAAVAAAMRESHYFEAPAAVYASGLYRNATEIAAANNEPLKAHMGGPTTSPPRRPALPLLAIGGFLTWAAMR